MVARSFPTNTGKALGLVAVGASLGFFVGPLYTGWRAAGTGSWRTPILELGLLGIVAAGIFLRYAREDSPERANLETARPSEKMFPNTTLWLFFIGASLAFSLRDFTGWSMGSLGSLFMQKAHGFDLNVTGLALSSIFLASIVSNPLFGGLSDRGRNRWLAFVLIVSAILVTVFPRVPKSAVIPVPNMWGKATVHDLSQPSKGHALMRVATSSAPTMRYGDHARSSGIPVLRGSWISRTPDQEASQCCGASKSQG